MPMLSENQPKLFGMENVASGKKRKFSTEELEKDNKILRTTMLKKRYADVIIKSQQIILGDAFDEKKMKKEVRKWEKQLKEEKAKSLQRDREAARIAIASIKRTVDFDDALQAEKDFLAIIGAPQKIHGEAFDGKEIMKKNVDLKEKRLREEKEKSQREKDREEARIAIASIKRTVDFDDALRAEKELLAIMHAPSCRYKSLHVS